MAITGKIGGSKPGSGTGGARKKSGRKKGSTNKITKETIEAVKEGGETPLEYLLKIMRQKIRKGTKAVRRDKLMSDKFEAAKAAAPYVHPKLITAKVDTKVSHNDHNELTDSELTFIANSGGTDSNKKKRGPPKPDQVH